MASKFFNPSTASTSANPALLASWYDDADCTVSATALPTNGDDVTLLGTVAPSVDFAVLHLASFTCIGLTVDALLASRTAALTADLVTLDGGGDSDAHHWGGIGGDACAFSSGARNAGTLGDHASFTNASNDGTCGDFASFTGGANNLVTGVVGDFASFDGSVNVGVVGDHASLTDLGASGVNINEGTVGDDAQVASLLNLGSIGRRCQFAGLNNQATLDADAIGADYLGLRSGYCPNLTLTGGAGQGRLGALTRIAGSATLFNITSVSTDVWTLDPGAGNTVIVQDVDLIGGAAPCDLSGVLIRLSGSAGTLTIAGTGALTGGTGSAIELRNNGMTLSTNVAIATRGAFVDAPVKTRSLGGI